jgi:hypothetical protein
MVNVATMIDCEGSNSGAIPTGTAFVGAYVSGIDGVEWTGAELAAWPRAREVRIYQGAGTYPGVGAYDAIDVEAEAVSVPTAISELEKRVQNNYDRTIFYAGDANAAAIQAAGQAAGNAVWIGHAYLWYANWDLSETEAEALLGKEVHGMTCIAVQWASPTSNPHTIIPGGTETLEEANVDLSVVDASLLPLPSNITVAAAPPKTIVKGAVVFENTTGAYQSKDVTSADGGNTWTSA